MRISSLPKSPAAAKLVAWVIAILCAITVGALAFSWRQANLIPPWEMSGVTPEFYRVYAFRLWGPTLLMAASAGALVLCSICIFLPLQAQPRTGASTTKPAERTVPRRRAQARTLRPRKSWTGAHLGVHRRGRVKSRITTRS